MKINKRCINMSIKMLVMDVDGTLTDGRLYIGAKGELMKSFDVKDGYAIAQLKKNGIEPVIITGRKSDIVLMRANELKITELYQGIEDKLSKLQEILLKRKILPEEVAYIGDDLNDIQCMKYCRLSGCPGDSVEQIKELVDYVCNNYGGRGAVREFIDEKILGY